MSRTIWKYELEMRSEPQPLELPAGWVFRRFDFQGGAPMVWVEVDPEQRKGVVTFQIVGTGQPIPERATYCGSEQIEERFYNNSRSTITFWVWHLYARQGA